MTFAVSAEDRFQTNSIKRKVDATLLPKHAEEAIEWKVLLDSGEATERDRRDLDAWIRRSDLNAMAWQRLQSRMAPIGDTVRVPMHRRLLEREPAGAGLTRRNLFRASGALCIVAASAAITDRFVPLNELTADKFTLTGQDATVRLSDGSVLTLGPRTAVNYDISTTKRLVSLLSGDLMIKSPDVPQNPLVLVTSEMTARSDGGQFVIRCRNGGQTLTAIDTAVSVSTSSGGVYQLDKENSLVFAHNRYEQRQADLPRETAWTEGLLIVRDHPLDDVIAGLRPYFPGVIRVDPIAGERRVTGVFPLANPGETIAQIGRVMELDVSWRTPFWVSIDQRASPTDI